VIRSSRLTREDRDAVSLEISSCGEAVGGFTEFVGEAAKSGEFRGVVGSKTDSVGRQLQLVESGAFA